MFSFIRIAIVMVSHHNIVLNMVVFFKIFLKGMEECLHVCMHVCIHEYRCQRKPGVWVPLELEL